MANKVVTPAAAAETQAKAGHLNPDIKTAGGDKNRRIMHLTLVIEDADVTPGDIYDALDAEFDVIAGEKDYLTHGTWILNIGPNGA